MRGKILGCNFVNNVGKSTGNDEIKMENKCWVEYVKLLFIRYEWSLSFLNKW